MRTTLPAIFVLTALAALAAPAAAQDAPDKATKLANALRAAPASITDGAAVMDWDGTVLREGDNGWTCFPDPPNMQAAPMCLDEAWLSWAQSWQNKTPVEIDRAGLAYMLHGDAGASNTDPWASGPTEDNDWVESGPHLMLIVPDLAALEGMPTDAHNGGPWVMWTGTPYAHVMIPVPGMK